MKKIVLNSVCLMFAGSSLLPVSAFAESVDKVIAVVGNEAIFKSEIESRVLMARLQYPEMAKDKGLSRSILEGQIDQKIILAKAAIDSITIDVNSLESMTNERFRQLTTRFSSTGEMESRFGKSSAAIRESIRDELRNQQLIEKLRQKKAAGVTVTYDEVMAFYKANRDQIAEIPEGVAVAQIVKYPAVLPESRAQSMATIKRIRAELQAGADFAALAEKYSEDPGSSRLGGDLGVVRKGQFIPAFENAAYSLREGGISDIVETRYGYHIIQLLSKEENSMHARHILIGIDRSNGDFSEAVEQLKRAYDLVSSGKESFAAMAKKYSDDPISAALGGTILAAGSSKPILAPSALLPQLQKIIGTLKKPGDISMPEKIEPPQGEPFYAIFRLNERIAAHALDPEKDYAYLEELALENKNRQNFNQWLQELRKEVYVRNSDI